VLEDRDDACRTVQGSLEALGYQVLTASAAAALRPEFQRMIEAGTSKSTLFDVLFFHSFSRFFRDHFELNSTSASWRRTAPSWSRSPRRWAMTQCLS
jgi:DNA invertase Pin-like site-specific DNA recombinase